MCKRSLESRVISLLTSDNKPNTTDNWIPALLSIRYQCWICLIWHPLSEGLYLLAKNTCHIPTPWGSIGGEISKKQKIFVDWLLSNVTPTCAVNYYDEIQKVNKQYLWKNRKTGTLSEVWNLKHVQSFTYDKSKYSQTCI